MKRGLHQGNEHLRHISRFIFQTLKKGWSEITLSDWWINIEITLDAIAPGYDHKSELKWEESSLLPKAKSDEKKLALMTSQINNIWLVDQLVKDNCWQVYHYAAFFICATYGNWMKFNRFDIFKGSPDPINFIFEMIVGKSRIQHRTTQNVEC